MPFLELGDHRLEYAWHGPPPGAAPTLVFLHHGLGSVSTWRDFPARLAEATGCGALVYSRRGHGRSSPARLPRPVSFMHEEAREALPRVLDLLGVREAALVGHSDGASIALIFASERRPAPRVRGLVLMAPHVFVEEETLAGARAAEGEFREGELRVSLARHHDDAGHAFRGWRDVWLDPAFRAWSLETLLPRVTAPVLVIQGDADEYGTLAQVDAIERGCGGEVRRLVLPGVGHLPFREAPGETLAASAAFLCGLR